MKNVTLKIFVSLCVYACLGVAVLFVSQKLATPTYADSETAPVEPAVKPEVRCGWFINPTPGNAWLNDKDGEWLIAAQGGYQAEGDWGADYKPNQWVETNGSHGYGCACMNVTTNKKTQRILTIQSFSQRPLSACRKDKKLKEPKDE